MVLRNEELDFTRFVGALGDSGDPVTNDRVGKGVMALMEMILTQREKNRTSFKAEIEKPKRGTLKIKEVAAFLGVSAETVRNLTRTGSLAATVTPGGHRRYDLGQVSEFKRKLKER